MKAFGLGILFGCIGLFAAIGGGYAAIAYLWPENFPAPPISRLAALDEKLRFIRENPQIDPTLLTIGSSIAWRQVAGEVYVKAVDRPNEFLNAATVHLQIHQTADLLDFYLQHYRNVQHVILLTSLPDYGDCSSAPAAMLDHEEAADYAFNEWPAAFFYMRYFAPQRFAGSVTSLASRMQPLTGDLYIDRFGSSPIHVPAGMRRGLRYGDIQTDSACLDALNDLVQSVSARGIELTIVYPPVHPEYLDQFPHSAERLDEIVEAAAAAAKHGNADIVDLHRYEEFADNDYFDAFHLDYTAIRRLSGKIIAQMFESATASHSSGS